MIANEKLKILLLKMKKLELIIQLLRERKVSFISTKWLNYD
jgi:hypothetical protein